MLKRRAISLLTMPVFRTASEWTTDKLATICEAVVFPLMKLSDSDVKIFEEDPEAFFRIHMVSISGFSFLI